MSLFAHYLSLPYLIEGIWFTVMVTALGLAGGLILGLVLAAMQLSRFAVLAALARGYTVIFRGTPLILQMVFAYDALPQIGLKLSAIGAAGLALAANEAPFIAEMLRAGVLGVDRGQILAGQALGMTPSLLMRRIIAPQAIRTMIPAFGNETVSALKNSSLASVISVQELTLRSTQLASSTFDFFSIFFASGLIYLVLTTLVSVIQLFVERALDLDRVTPQGRLSVFLPWRRADLATRTRLAEPVALLAPPHSLLPEMTVPRPTSRSDRAKHAAMVQRNNVAVEVTGLRKRYGGQTVLDGARSDGAGRRGRGPARPQRLGQEHAAALHQPSRELGFRHGAGRWPPSRTQRRRPEAVAAGDCQRTRRRRRRHGVPAVQPVQPSDRARERRRSLALGARSEPHRRRPPGAANCSNASA